MLLLISVLVAASNQDKKFWNAFLNILSRNFSSIHCIGRTIDARCDNAQLVIADTKSFDLVYSDMSIVIYKDAMPMPVQLETQKQSLAVVDSCNKELLQLVSGTNLPAITCGLSPKDTITLSSINDDSAVIDVQRSIICFDGSVVEPQEIPVTLNSPIDNFTLMAAATIFIVCGDTGRLSQIKI